MIFEAERTGEHFRQIAGLLGAQPAAIEPVLHRLIAAYTGAGRHYHDIRHIDALLQLALLHRSALRDPVAVDLAILFHDAVYDPERHDLTIHQFLQTDQSGGSAQSD